MLGLKLIHFSKRMVGPRHLYSWYYSDVIMGAMASELTRLTIVYLTVYSEIDQRKHQSSASLAFMREIHLWPVNFPHRWPVTQKMFPSSSWYALCCGLLCVDTIHKRTDDITITKPNKTNRVHIIFRSLSARLQYLQCVSNGDTAVLR